MISSGSKNLDLFFTGEIAIQLSIMPVKSTELLEAGSSAGSFFICTCGSACGGTISISALGVQFQVAKSISRTLTDNTDSKTFFVLSLNLAHFMVKD